ncbi:MAG: asparagine synthase B [Rhodothermaeota bacterium MED-G19]|nr:MAG: asparagine synthase B [Rhodothermaeota bacterium MED-G19]
MCGIVAIYNNQIKFDKDMRSKCLEMSKKVRHRGPDWSGIYSTDNAILAHERLSIVDIKSGRQPLFSNDENIILTVNGEIYNHLDFRNSSKIDYKYQTNSDCEVIIPLYKKYGCELVNHINGIFSFFIYNKFENSFFVARDPIGVIPLYMGNDDNGTYYFSSEMKCLVGKCSKIKEFPPGHYMTNNDNNPIKYYNKDWMNYDNIKNNNSKTDLRESLEDAVKRQLMSDVPFGVLLSGGLDSSVISSIVKKFSKKRIESNQEKDAWWPQIHSFAVGLKGSPDLIAASKVSKHLGTIHHEIHFTIQEALDSLEDVIYYLETYDVTTVRASTPMYLMGRYIKSMGVKMVLSGEGADEIFGGYLYFHKAPNAREFHEETVRKINKLHLFDCLRANKSLSAWGVEGRVPFLDKEFIDYSMNIDPKLKMIRSDKIEKHILRDSFNGYLPNDILWRQKEQFSDGVGYSWIDSLKEHAENSVSDKDYNNRLIIFPVNTPKSKEEFLFRRIFEKHFPGDDCALCVPSSKSVACSTEEALKWDKSFLDMNDPSGRSIKKVHKDSY